MIQSDTGRKMSTRHFLRWPYSGGLYSWLPFLFAITSAQISTTTTDSTSAITGSTSVTSDSSSSTTPTSRFVTISSSRTSFGSPTDTTRPLDSDTCQGLGCDGNSNSRSNDSHGYYAAFIAIFVIVLVLALWIVHQRKRKHIHQTTTNRRSALARDMQNEQFDQLYPNNRRWVGEGRGGRRSRYSGPTQRRQEEGLDEEGEAPPPYKTDGQGNETTILGPHVDIPLQSLQRDGNQHKPPGYNEDTQARPPASVSNQNP